MKKLLAIIISLSVILSCCIIGGITASAAVEVWDGTTAQPVDSDSNGVYEINNAAELAWVAQNDTDKSYILTADIYLNDLKVEGETITKLDGSAVDTASLEPWISNKEFAGILDGDGYTVNGIYNATQDSVAGSTNARGLFGKGCNATVKNLRISNVYLSGGTYMGAVFGYANSGNMLTVDNCYIENIYTATSLANNGDCYPSVGGILGYTQSSGLTINNTAIVNYYGSNATQISRVGSILGDAWLGGNMTVTNTYVVSDIRPYGNGTSGASNFKGTNTVSNFYSTTATNGTIAPQSVTVNKGLLTSDAALVSAYGLGDKFYTTAGYPMQELFLDEITSANKQLGTAPFEGSGTETDPYLISDADDLRNAIGTYGGYYYELTNDIYLNDIDKINWKTGEVADGYTANEWFVSTTDISGYYYNGYAGVGRFTGTVDGAGYSVHGIYYDRESLSTVTGLFPATNNATIKNLAIENSYITGARLNGGFAGYTNDNTTVDSCLVADTVSVVGYNGGNAYVTAAYVGEDGKGKSPFNKNVVAEGGANYESIANGGIIGYGNKNATVTNCAVYGDVRSISDEEKFSTTNPLTNGGNPVVVSNGNHLCALIGTGWNSTITITDNVSLVQPHDKLSGGTDNGKPDGNPLYSTTCENNYALTRNNTNDVTQTCCNVVTEADMTGANALTNMPGLDTAVWTATAGYPMPKVFTCFNTTAHAGEHSWTDWAETTTPDCDEPGEETRECVVCGEGDSNPLPENGHAPATDWTKDDAGHWHACANCTDKLDYAVHTFDQKVEKTEYSAGTADCDSPAEFYYSCVCGAKGDNTFTSGTAMGHSPKTEWTTDENNHWHECNNCDAHVDEAPHTFDQEVVADDYLASAADCVSAATYYKSCVCGAKGAETFTSGEANGHTPKENWDWFADKHFKLCDICGVAIEETEGAHNVQGATCSSLGECTICGREGDEYDEDNHDLKDVPAGEASHDEDGNIAHKECNDCGKLFNDAGEELDPEDVIVDGGDHDFSGDYKSDKDGHWKECECGGKDTKANHSYGEWEVEEEASAATPGKKVRKCSACGFEEEGIIPATGENAPQTGDNVNTLPWILLSMVSILALAGATLFFLRKSKA